MRKIATDLHPGDVIVDPKGNRHIVTTSQVVPGVAVHFQTDTGADIEHSWIFAAASTYDIE